jgi:regulator of replication initiation timing
MHVEHEITKLAAQMNSMKADQGKLFDALMEMASELNLRSDKLRNEMSNQKHEVLETSREVSRAATAQTDLALATVRQEFLRFCRGVE